MELTQAVRSVYCAQCVALTHNTHFIYKFYSQKCTISNSG